MDEKLKIILDNYVRLIIIHGEASNQSRVRKANRYFKRIYRALDKLREYGEEGKEALVSVLSHEDGFVRCYVATHLLNVEPEKAIKTLNKLAKLKNEVGGDARMVLQVWEDGTLNDPKNYF